MDGKARATTPDMPMRMYAFHCGGDRSNRAFYDPFDDDVSAVVYGPYFFYLIAHPKGNILFDTGMHPRWQADVLTEDGVGLRVGRGDDVLSKLGAVDLSPGDISHVIVSHLHSDHAGGLCFFPDATIIIQGRELQFAHQPPPYQADFFDPRDFSLDLNWLKLDGDLDLFGDARVVVIATPGHTPGHQSALVRLRSRPYVLAGDAHYWTDKMRMRRLPSVVWSPDEMLASWQRLEALERDQGAQLIFTHELGSEVLQQSDGTRLYE